VLSFVSTTARCTGTQGWSTSISGAPLPRSLSAQTSHTGRRLRLAELFRPGEVVCDLMAGIGPFAIPAARRRVTVHANDLNPRCAHYLRMNVRVNKVRRSRPHIQRSSVLRSTLTAGRGPGARLQCGTSKPRSVLHGSLGHR